MNGFDVQSAMQVSKMCQSLVRRAEMFGKSREEILEELLHVAMDYAKLAERIEKQMEQEAA